MRPPNDQVPVPVPSQGYYQFPGINVAAGSRTKVTFCNRLILYPLTCLCDDSGSTGVLHLPGDLLCPSAKAGQGKYRDAISYSDQSSDQGRLSAPQDDHTVRPGKRKEGSNCPVLALFKIVPKKLGMCSFFGKQRQGDRRGRCTSMESL